jgi:hypothetical protein
MSNKPDRRVILLQDAAAISLVAALACGLSSQANASRPESEPKVAPPTLASRVATIVEWVRAGEPALLRDLPPQAKMAQFRNR